MKLNEKDKIILQAIQHRAQVPIEQIASLCSMQVTTVRRAICKLEEAGILTKKFLVDHTKLGFTNYSLSFALKNTKEQQRDKVKSWLLQRDGVGYFGTIGGEYEFELTYLSRDPSDLTGFLDSLSQQAGASFRNKIVVMETHYIKYGVRFGDVSEPEVPVLSWTHRDIVPQSKQDRTTLAALMAAESRTMTHLARDLKIPTSTLRYRVQQLEDKEILIGSSYDLHLEKCGFRRFYVYLSLNSLCDKTRSMVKEYCAKVSSAEYLLRGVGHWDYKIIFQLQDEIEMETAVERLRESLGDSITSLSVVPQFKVLRKNTYPFAPPFDD